MIGFFDPNDPTFTFKLSRLSVRALVDFGYVQIAAGEPDPQVVTGLGMAAPGGHVHHLNCSIGMAPKKDATIYIDNPPY
jgi:1,4-dihydroxy-2-naphthoyl-CoA synthase